MGDQPVYVVTGAGPGSLGEATARALRDHGRVITTRRSGPSTADFHQLDLADAGSVRAFVDWLGEATDRVDVLVNNAGIHLDLRRKWHEPQLLDGHEIHWRTNYLGTAQLTRLLVPTLLRTASAVGEARVVNVVSKLHTRGRNQWLDGGVEPYDSWDAYGTSKLALVHEAAEIERRYGEQGLHGYALHPGAVYTKVADRGLETAPVLGRLRRLLAPVERRTLTSPEVGARTTVFCATSADAVPGGYHVRSAPADASPEAADVRAGTGLWERTSAWADSLD
ncbi:MAG TPA: SDR family NAD(P)-dependent oxidoreductase [Nocardioides sp.]|nr:SDR family NAD(P)-dependent oxidoreductase [Nocardioides sp.]